MSTHEILKPVISSLPATQPYKDNRADIYLEKLRALMDPVMEEVGFHVGKVKFSRPIDPTMAFASSNSISICPLFVMDFDQAPEAIRPLGADDPRITDLAFVQAIADWVSQECRLKRQTVQIVDIATLKTILKLKEDPKKFLLAIQAGAAHELGHIALKHHAPSIQQPVRAHYTVGFCTPFAKIGSIFERYAVSRRKEREADLFAATHLKNGLEGIKIGFSAWKASLKELRSCKKFSFKERLLLKLLVASDGNLRPLYLTHGSFDSRIKHVENALKV